MKINTIITAIAALKVVQANALHGKDELNAIATAIEDLRIEMMRSAGQYIPKRLIRDILYSGTRTGGKMYEQA